MDVMVDIETLAVSNMASVILSVAALPFRMERTGPLLGGASIWILDLREQLMSRTVDPSTQKFWAAQSSEASKHWLAPQEQYSVALFADAFCDFMKRELDNGTTEDPSCVWSNGICFDLGNLETMLLQCGRAAPWKYNAPRDYRTLVRVMPKLRKYDDSKEVPLVHHDPVSDCIHQTRGLWEHWPFDQIDVDTRDAM